MANSQSSPSPSSSKRTDKKANGKPHKPSYGEVFASAHVVLNAAKNKLHLPDSSSPQHISYGKLAGAAGTLLGAASHSGKLKKTSFAKYANKAQVYLHSYEIKHNEIEQSNPGMTVDPPSQPSAHHASSGYAPSTHTSSEVNHCQPTARPQGYPAGYTSSEVNHSQASALPQGHPPSTHTSYEVNHSQPYARPQGYLAQYAYSEVNHSQPSAPPQGYPAGYTSSEVNHSQPSAPPQGYPGYPPQVYTAGYRPPGYPDAQQNYGYGPQSHSKLAEAHVNVGNYSPVGYPPVINVDNYPPVGYPPVNVDNYPPVGYPPAGYLMSSGDYNRPSKYS